MKRKDDLKTALMNTYDQQTDPPLPFLSDNHSPNEIELVPLELIHSSRDALRKALETYFIERGQTLEPNGINKREEL